MKSQRKLTPDMPRARHRNNWRQWLKDLMRRQATIDRELPEAVALARRQGASWSDIGAVLGISQQAAHKRFRDLDGDPDE
jgi:hypothetical protein